MTATRRADPRSAVNRPTHSPAWVDGHGRTEGPGPGLQIRRSDRDELGLARMLPGPDESACALQGDHEQRSRADWFNRWRHQATFGQLRILGYELRERSPAPDRCA